MLRTIAGVLFAAVAALLIFATTKPDNFEVKRSIEINTPAAKIYPMISDLKKFNDWNPFLAQDPASKLTYGTITAGKGAAYSWQGEKSGAGRMELTDADEPSRLLFNLEFSKPMEGHNKVEFTLAPQANGTRVSWAMRGPMPFVSKLMTIFFDMDKMVGSSFEAGLAQLKKLAENEPATR